jgi:aromatic ring-opening dioxygenase catalytic subunit (LigB family)
MAMARVLDAQVEYADATTRRRHTGFPDEMYQIKWTPAGSPEIAERVAGALRAEGVDCRADPKHGLDHGAWVPLHLMYPEADIPVLQLSIIDSFIPSDASAGRSSPSLS